MPGSESARECDVLVVGYGGAGAAAAITAAELGADVLVIERTDDGGGSTRDSGGNVREILDVDKVLQHYSLLIGTGTPLDVIEACVRVGSELPAWLAAHGGKQIPAEPHGKARPQVYPATFEGSVYDHISGADGLGHRYRVVPSAWSAESGPPAAGPTLWQVLASSVAELKVPILYSTRARKLIRDESSGRVVGASCDTAEGSLVIRARKGVILACGGFADNSALKLDYIGADLPTLCTPGRRTGDGIQMAQAVGADLHHMRAIAATYGYTFPDTQGAFAAIMRGPGFLITGNDGRRYADEAGLEAHAAGIVATLPNAWTAGYQRMPSFMIFDDETRYDGPIVRLVSGHNAGFDWSHDNSREVKRGWISRGETYAELARELGLPSATLAATIEEFNAACSGTITDPFGRPIESMRALASPPYFGLPMWPVLFNTQGGPRRDAQCRVRDVFGDAIPGLFSAGELGSMWSVFYPGAGNITEALATGILASQTAVRS